MGPHSSESPGINMDHVRGEGGDVSVLNGHFGQMTDKAGVSGVKVADG